MKDKDIQAGNLYKINDIEHPYHGKNVGVHDILPSLEYFNFFVSLEENSQDSFYIRSDQLAPYNAEIPEDRNWKGYKKGDAILVLNIGSAYDGWTGEIVELIDDQYVIIRLDDNNEEISVNTDNIGYSRKAPNESTSMGMIGDTEFLIGEEQELSEPNPVAIIDLEDQRHYYYTDDVLMRMHEQDRLFYVIGSDGSLLAADVGISFKRVK